MLKALGRSAIRAWARAGKGQGYCFLFSDRFWPYFSNGQPVASRLPNGCVVWCDLSNNIERTIWLSGLYEPVEAFLFCRLVRPGMTVVDVGANVGQYVLLSSTAVGTLGRVHAFEPVPANYHKLERNVYLNNLKNVFLNRVALWHENGEVTLDLPAAGCGDAGAYGIVEGREVSSRSSTAPALRLDDYVREHNIERVDVIKVDIEGGEPFFLQGASATLSRDHPTILAEVNKPALEAMGTSLNQYWTTLAKLGYRAWRIGPHDSSSRPIPDLSSITLDNVLFHVDELPPDITSTITLKKALRWAKSGWSSSRAESSRDTPILHWAMCPKKRVSSLRPS